MNAHGRNWVSRRDMHTQARSHCGNTPLERTRQTRAEYHAVTHTHKHAHIATLHHCALSHLLLVNLCFVDLKHLDVDIGLCENSCANESVAQRHTHERADKHGTA
jgi:hypothetical protein